jgi:hypothetical protein
LQKTKNVTIDEVVWAYETVSDGTLKVYPAYEQTGDGARTYLSGLAGDIAVPSEIKNKKVTQLADSAFYKAEGVVSVTVPEGVTALGADCFYGCTSLKEVSLPATLASVGDGAFSNCVSLTSVALPASLASLGDGVFAGCDFLADIQVAAGSEAFSSLDGVLMNADQTELVVFPAGKMLSEYSVAEGVRKLGPDAFCDTSYLKTLYLPSSLAEIETRFDRCTSLAAISVARRNLSFMSLDGVLYDRSGETLVKYPCAKDDEIFTVPLSVKTISDYAFGSATNLGGNRYLQSLTITANVAAIGDFAFANCNALTVATFAGRPASIGEGIFSECKNLIISVGTADLTYFTGALTALDPTATITTEKVDAAGGYIVEISYAMIKIGDFEYYCEIRSKNSAYTTVVMRLDSRGTQEVLTVIEGQYRFDYLDGTYEGSDYRYLYFTALDMAQIYGQCSMYAFNISADSFSRIFGRAVQFYARCIRRAARCAQRPRLRALRQPIVAVNLSEARINEYPLL